MKSLYTCVLILVVLHNIRSMAAPKTYEDYRAAVLSIERSVVDLTAAQDLFGVTNFVALYETPKDCVSNAVIFLKDQTNSESGKLIVICSLQRLPLADYVAFERNLLAMAERKQVPIPLLNKAIFPGLEWSTKLQCKYEDADVKALLAMFLKSELISESNKSYVKEIITGKTCQEIKDFQESGAVPKRASE